MRKLRVKRHNRRKVVVVCVSVIVLITSLISCKNTDQKNLKADSEMISSQIEKSEYSKTEQQGITSDELGDLRYNEILSEFKRMITIRLSESFQEDYNSRKISLYYPSDDETLRYEWGCMLIEATSGIENPRIESYGYALKDINLDGVEELILTKEDHTILAVFTSCNGKTQLLGAYWPRYSAVMVDSGLIFVRSSGGAGFVTYSLYKLDKGASVLTKTTEFGHEGKEYYQIKNAEKQIIDEKGYEDLLNENPFENSLFWKDVEITNFS